MTLKRNEMLSRTSFAVSIMRSTKQKFHSTSNYDMKELQPNSMGSRLHNSPYLLREHFDQYKSTGRVFFKAGHMNTNRAMQINYIPNVLSIKSLHFYILKQNISGPCYEIRNTIIRLIS